MAYEVRFTDNINKSNIVVEDATLNEDTSLGFPGRQFPGYGQVVAENFLHLLENFANTTAPERPVEGQLWYDNTQGIDQLKIYDGAQWLSAGGLKKGVLAPEVSNSIAGDLWANTDTQQLYLFTGTDWILIGPEFSDGLLTGLESQIIIGTDDVSYVVLALKIQNQTVAILSSDFFIPKSAIVGFTKQPIQIGLNLFDNTQTVYKYNGTSQKAEALVVGNVTVNSEKFVRNDVVANFTDVVKVNTDNGLTIGSNSQLSFKVQSQTAIISNAASGASVDFSLRSGVSNNTVLRIDASKRIGINNIAPEEALDIIGNVLISPDPADVDTGTLKITGTTESTAVDEGALIVAGGAGIAGDMYVGGELVVGTDDSSTNSGLIRSRNIEPTTNNTFSIGSTSSRYLNLYANNIFGNIQGNLIGTVTGRSSSSDKLTTATTFGITGDVTDASFAFDGQTGGTNKTFNVQIANSFISTKSETFDSPNTDEVVISRDAGLFKISKSNFLRSIPIFPVGIILPYSGEDAPSSWLLCNGTVVSISSFFNLFQVIGYSFRSPDALPDLGVNSFALPDMRGRMPLGLDNMGGISADVVTSSIADILGASGGGETTDIEKRHLPDHEHDLRGNAGTQHYAVTPTAGTPDTDTTDLAFETGTLAAQGILNSGGLVGGGAAGDNIYREEANNHLGAPLDVINPFVALNYIIYTGT
jgi:microcystin-dependent protein